LTTDQGRTLIDTWFPCAAVDEACGNRTGSGQVEKAIFTWFASRPIAQARAAVATALLPDSASVRQLVDGAVRGDLAALAETAARISERYPDGRPVVLDIFSGRGIIALEAARLGAQAVGLDLSPVATLAGRVLADYPLQDWSAEPALPWRETAPRDATLFDEGAPPRLVADLEVLLAEIGRRTQIAVAPHYPRNPDGSLPWGYLWAISIPCDGCSNRFPLLGSFVLRHPYGRTNDAGQSLRLLVHDGTWTVEVVDGLPDQAPTYSSTDLGDGRKRKGKSARCPFCQQVHSLETVKAKGIAGEYRDELLVAIDTQGEAKRIFRTPRPDERIAATAVDLSCLKADGPLSAVPDEVIAAGNVHTVMASGYGYRTFGELMNARQALQFAELVRAIRSCYHDALTAGISPQYARALTAFASATLARRLRRATRGCAVQAMGKSDGTGQNRNKVSDLFANEASLNFQFDWVETGPGSGPGTWASLSHTGLGPYEAHIRGLRGSPARFRQANAMRLPYRDASVDAVVTDPPYYDMIEYADASDLMYVWLKRVLFDIEPDLFGPKSLRTSDGLQNKDDEIIVRRVHETGRVRHDKDFYESSLSAAFLESRRVLRPDGHLVVVFGHSDPDAWKRLLAALHDAGFVVTSSWPSRTESANTKVASVKVTITIGCRVAPMGREAATAAQVDREIADAIRPQVRNWTQDGLALADQMMAAYGPAMEVYGRYSTVIQPDGESAPLERYLTLARRCVREATALRLDRIPIETFDAITRFAVFWMRVHGRTVVAKGEAIFLAQVDGLRLEDVRGKLLAESGKGFRLILDPPASVGPGSAEFDVARALAGAYISGGTEAASLVLAQWERPVDDEHLWAVIGDLAAQLPPSDTIAKALVALQRNTSTIKNIARGLAGALTQRNTDRHLTLFDVEDAR
jgi:putative DNA methylase